jgi:hypothetical protein
MNETQKKSFAFRFAFWAIAFLFFSSDSFSRGNSKSRCATRVKRRASRPLHYKSSKIDAAAKQFALENHKTNGEAINFPNDLTPYIKLNSQGKIPGCPGGGIYTIKKVGDKSTCSLGYTVTPAHVLP